MTRGGPRPGAGRRPSPRHTPEEARAILDELAGGDTDAELARRLGVSRSYVGNVRRDGATTALLERWRGRIAAERRQAQAERALTPSPSPAAIEQAARSPRPLMSLAFAGDPWHDAGLAMWLGRQGEGE